MRTFNSSHSFSPLLISYFLKKSGTTKTFSSSARKNLQKYLWPGNIYELQQVIKQAIIFSGEREIIEADDLQISPAMIADKRGLSPRPLQKDFDLTEELARISRLYIKRALKQANGRKSEAAKLLGLKSYQALDVKIKIPRH